jgi:hypothetical protein
LVGGLHFSPEQFFDMTPNECMLVMQGSKEREREKYYINLSCLINAVGSCLGKSFKMQHPWDNEDEKPIDKAKKKEELLAEYEKLANEEW